MAEESHSTQDYSPANHKALNAVKRLKDRARYDADSVFAIVDSGLIAHVGFQTQGSLAGSPDDEEDWPYVVPMVFGRKDDTIYLHGYISGRLVKHLSHPTTKACITITHVDGLVYALSAFHNSMNYRSAMLFGHARLVEDADEKIEALKIMTNHALKTKRDGYDRWGESREATPAEIKSTRVVAVKIDSASAKVRTGSAKDDAVDYENEELNKRIWTGVIPVEQTWGVPIDSSYTQAQCKFPGQ
ncbi:hypothetical protein BJ742DRAFT_834164 [Cladochytrium replicatum]|nr:hypothetical protein BJ742DRAFT_834164 [Cladochytrium replicatum]